MNNIETIYAEGVVERTEFGILERTEFTKQTLADLYAEVEQHRLSVFFVFIPTKNIKAMRAITRDTAEGEMGVSATAPKETDAIGYLGHAWGAEYYVVDDLDAIYATSLYKQFDLKGAVAKLIIKD